MSSTHPPENRRRLRLPARLVGTLPPRVLGHALVIALSVGVAYAGQGNRLTSQFGLGTLAGNAAQLSAFANPGGVLSKDTVVEESVAPAPQPERNQVIRYVVQPGDTLASLADRFNLTENTILWSNGLSESRQLRSGQELLIPPVSGLMYTVQAGDTVDGIAQRFETDPGSILQFNTVDDPTHPAVGAVLVVPGGRLPESSRARLSNRSAVRPPERPSEATVRTDPQPQPARSTAPAVFDLPRLIPFSQRFAAPQPLRPIVYVVTDGDTLSGIAQKFGVSPESIAASNGLVGNEDSLTIKQKLLVPPVPGVLHVVGAGDTLEGIAERYSARAEDIAKANGLSDPFVLQLGQTLVVPGGKPVVEAPAAPPAPPQPQVSYTVQEGDSVSSIADAYGVDPQTIIDANGLSDPYVVQPGEKIVIPGVSGPAQPVAAPAPSAPVAKVAAAPAPRQVAAAAAPAPAVHRAAAPAPAPRPAPAPAPAPAKPAGGWAIVSIASRYLGVPYVWGGVSPSGFDCSGLVWYVYQKAGIPIPRDLYGQLQSGTRISRGNLLPGDIVFFSNTYQPGLSHNGIYIGGGRFINAVDYGIGVQVRSINDSYWSAHYYGATRPW